MAEVAPDALEALAAALAARGWRMATAESCTGGAIAQLMTSRPGSSEWFECGYVTYSNAAKSRMLGVPAALIADHGAVSAPVVTAMADGARSDSGVELAVAVSGVAGPDGGSPDKPVGTVWLAWSCEGRATRCVMHHFSGDRDAVRRAAVAAALRGLLDALAH